MAELPETVARLRESEHQLRLVTDNAPVGMVHWDGELRYKFMNRYHAERLKEHLGVTPEQAIGKRLPEVIGDKFFAIIEPYILECLAGKSVEFDIEVPFVAEDFRFLHCRFEPEWRDGKVVGVVAAGVNVTNLKRAEAALRDSEAKFRAMFECTSVAKVESEYETGRFLRANAAMCEFVGYSEAELLARTVFDITHPDERERDRALLRRMVAGELAVFNMEKRYIRKDGKTVWARTTANIIHDASGRPTCYTVVVQNIGPRKQAEQALRATNNRLQLALDTAQIGWWRYDPRRGVVSGDTRFKEIFDVASDEIPVEDIKRLVHPDDVERFLADREAASDPDNPKRSPHEYRVQRRDGEVRWVEVRWLAYFDEDQRDRRTASVVGAVHDITDRKQREEREHLLMREINHRAKNMLSVVDAIAHQTATRTPEDFIERFSERIQALSANQDLLIRNEWHGVEVEDLVRAQLAPFADLIGSRIALYGPKLRLNAAAAQAIGLALHELSTNAGKYGALSTDTGHVDVSWGAADDTFTMGWIEREGPPVSAPQQRGFGTTVMQAMAMRSVGGAVDLDYAPSGLIWRLTCPAANVLEPMRT